MRRIWHGCMPSMCGSWSAFGSSGGMFLPRGGRRSCRFWSDLAGEGGRAFGIYVSIRYVEVFGICVYRIDSLSRARALL